MGCIMHKRRQEREERRRIEDEKRKKAVVRNWVIAVVTLLIAMAVMLYTNGSQSDAASQATENSQSAEVTP